MPISLKTGRALATAAALLLLAACGSKAPVEPAETALYGKVTMENAPASAMGTVVYLGYYESADAMKAELPEVLKDLPLAEMGGGEAYAIIPRFEGESVTLYAVTMKEDAATERAKNGTVYDGAVLLMCNESDIFANTEVELKLGEDSISFGPYISLMDGSVVTHGRVPVGTIQ